MVRWFRRLVCALSLAMAGLPGLSAESRLWMDIEGRTLDAVYLEQDDGQVRIRRVEDGQEFTLPTARLSQRDRSWLAERLQQEQREKQEQRARQSERQSGPLHERPPLSFPEGGLVWPDRVGVSGDLEVEIVREDNQEQVYIYRTRNFEFISDTKLARRVVSEFAVIFEVTLEGMKAQPLAWRPRVPQEGYRARLFRTMEDYYAAGGPEGTGGVYISSSREILVPLSSLGVRGSSSGVRLDRHGGGHGTLVHEVTHQVHHDWLPYLPVWLTEGLAVYMEAVPLERGELRFSRTDPEKYIRDEAGYRGDLPMIHPSKLMTMSNEDWARNWTWNPLDVGRYYNSAFLLTYYFAHLDGDGDGRRLWDYLRQIEAGTPASEAGKTLLAGRTYDQLADDIQRSYRRMRVRLQMF